MKIFVSFLPFLLWGTLFIVLIKKFKFHKRIFLICFGIAFAMMILSWTATSGVVHIYDMIGQTVLLYVVVDLIYSLVKRKKDSRFDHLDAKKVSIEEKIDNTQDEITKTLNEVVGQLSQENAITKEQLKNYQERLQQKNDEYQKLRNELGSIK